MRILICGIDGYLGWPLSLRLSVQGHEVWGLDNFFRRDTAPESAIPILAMRDRLDMSTLVDVEYADLFSFDFLCAYLRQIKPEVIIHLAEQPSAPYSMASREQCLSTIENNVLGTMNLLYAMKNDAPDAHLIKLGSMGGYGTPNCTIPEGQIPDECLGDWADELDGSQISVTCPMSGLPFPASPGSFYDATKVAESVNIRLACQLWGLSSTDIMQGVVYGTRTDQMILDPALATRFDYDQYFGTVINRFCAQAIIEHPLTVYGQGTQVRSFLSLQDSMNCIDLIAQNPPEKGEYRVVNQFTETHSIDALALYVFFAARKFGLTVPKTKIVNPRVEENLHVYRTNNAALRKMGYKPSGNIQQNIEGMLEDLISYKDRIDRTLIMPTTDWRK